MIKSVLAVIAGFMTTTVLVVGADAVVHALAPNQFSGSVRTSNTTLLCLALAYSALFAVIGSYVAARLAPRNPKTHAMILGGIAFALSLAATVAAWQSAPPWYHLIALAVILPAAWVGGQLRAQQVATTQSV